MDKEWLSHQAEVCSSVSELREKYALSPIGAATIDAAGIVVALKQFQECVRYLNTRRSTGAVLNLDSEAAVQDAIYLMLRLWVHDLAAESPTERVANRYTIKDFVSRQARTVIEVKFIRDGDHGKKISKELNDDIETYRHHVHCDTLIFFIYDPESLIPDQQQLKAAIEEERVYGGRSGRILRCVLIVMP